MTSLLDLPEIRERVSPISVAEYHRLGEFNENGRRTELVRGILLEKMSKSPLHRFITEKLRAILETRITSGSVVFSQDPLTAKDSEPEPDVMVVKGAKSEFRQTHPTTAELVAEVSVTSLGLDRAKAGIYAEAGVQEYWIVLPTEKQVEVYREPSTKGYATCVLYRLPAVLECVALPGVRVDLDELLGE